MVLQSRVLLSYLMLTQTSIQIKFCITVSCSWNVLDVVRLSDRGERQFDYAVSSLPLENRESNAFVQVGFSFAWEDERFIFYFCSIVFTGYIHPKDLLWAPNMPLSPSPCLFKRRQVMGN